MILLESFHVKGKNIRKHNISRSGEWGESCVILPVYQPELTLTNLHISSKRKEQTLWKRFGALIFTEISAETTTF